MSESIILGQQRLEMVLCSVCPDPGLCCRNFDSTLTYWDDASPQEVRSYIDFLNGRQFSHWKFDCRKVDRNGRCTIYQERPNACRTFVPGATEICAFHKILPVSVLENGVDLSARRI